ncbi:MAG: hypothetical protein ACSHWY_15310 [Octadecabacter sp.]
MRYLSILPALVLCMAANAGTAQSNSVGEQVDEAVEVFTTYCLDSASIRSSETRLEAGGFTYLRNAGVFVSRNTRVVVRIDDGSGADRAFCSVEWLPIGDKDAAFALTAQGVVPLAQTLDGNSEITPHQNADESITVFRYGVY